MAIDDGERVVRGSTLSRGLGESSKGAGCRRCGSTCSLLDDCAVCRGDVICARCLFGARVDADEIHATFVLEG